MPIFFIKKDSLTLSQQVSPQRRHCAGSLQAFNDKRPKVGHIQTQNSKHHRQQYLLQQRQPIIGGICDLDRRGYGGDFSEGAGFFIEKNSLTLSQQVSLRRHCTGSLQNREWRRLLRVSRWMWFSKLWHYLFGQVQPRRRPPVLVETVYKQTWGERTYISHKFSHVKLFNGESQAPGEVMVDAYRH